MVFLTQQPGTSLGRQGGTAWLLTPLDSSPEGTALNSPHFMGGGVEHPGILVAPVPSHEHSLLSGFLVCPWMVSQIHFQVTNNINEYYFTSPTEFLMSMNAFFMSRSSTG